MGTVGVDAGATADGHAVDDPDLGPIATFIRLDLIGTVAGLAGVVLANGLFVRAPGVWLITPFLVALTILLVVASRQLRSGDIGGALALIMGGNWLIAVAVAAILPFMWPVMAITVLMPLVLATPYLRQRTLVLALTLGAMVAGVVALMGLLNDDGGAVPDIEDEFEVVLVVGALMAQVLPVALIVWQNNDLQQRNLLRSRALNRELRASEAQLAVSRRRVVDAGDAERRRIERNLHDGAQQRLVALGVRLRLLEDQVSHDQEVKATVGALVGELEEAVDEVRELAHGIYPPLLRSQGLKAALRAVARRSASPVETELADIGRDGDERLDESIETALYFTALEALTNASKHAPGAEVTMRLGRTGDEIVLVVDDAGPGFDAGGGSLTDSLAGSQGLSNMEDRLAAVDGRLVVNGEPGRGTTITAITPAVPADPADRV